MNNDIISWIQERIRQSKYRLTLHAELERDYDQITLKEIEDALLSKIEIIEEYPHDQRGSSALILGFTKEGKPIHFVCGQGNRTMLVIITVYVPDENLWINYRKRKELCMKQCYICKGKLIKEKIRHFHQWGEHVVLFENLEVERCTQCGEVFLEPTTLEMIDAKTKDIFVRKVPHTNLCIPVVS